MVKNVVKLFFKLLYTKRTQKRTNRTLLSIFLVFFYFFSSRTVFVNAVKRFYHYKLMQI